MVALRLPAVEGEEEVRGIMKCEPLTEVLNMLQYRAAQLREEVFRADVIFTAIQDLAEGIPRLRGELVDALDASLRWAEHGVDDDIRPFCTKDQLDGARKKYGELAVCRRADLAALDALIAAAKVVREREIPLRPIGILGWPTQAERWQGYAISLADTFQRITDGSKEAATGLSPR
jgi:hypothetical protein